MIHLLYCLNFSLLCFPTVTLWSREGKRGLNGVGESQVVERGRGPGGVRGQGDREKLEA